MLAHFNILAIAVLGLKYLFRTCLTFFFFHKIYKFWEHVFRFWMSKMTLLIVII